MLLYLCYCYLRCAIFTCTEFFTCLDTALNLSGALIFPVFLFIVKNVHLKFMHLCSRIAKFLRLLEYKS